MPDLVAKFKENKLYAITHKERVIISAWPDLRVWVSGDGGWEQADQAQLNLEHMIFHAERYRRKIKCLSAAAKARLRHPGQAYQSFLDTVPPQVIEWTIQYPTCHWRIMRTFAKLGAPAENLARGGAWAVLYLLTNSELFRSTQGRTVDPLEWAKSKVRCKQRFIIGELGFPATKSAAKILRKLPPKTCSARWLTRLTRLLEIKWITKRLVHLPEVNKDVLQIVEHPIASRCCHPKLLLRLAEDSGRSTRDAGKCFKDVVYAARLLDEGERVKNIQTIASLLNLSEELEVRRGLLLNQDLEFPKPSLPGIPGVIEPITTPAELLIEGQRMHHCIGEFMHAIAEGKHGLYAYSVLENTELGTERATLLIEVANDGAVHIKELRGVQNNLVSHSTQEQVKKFTKQVVKSAARTS